MSGGSLQDHIRLEDAFHRYNTAAVVSAFLNLRCGSENERTRRQELASAAALCGWTPEHALTVWADQRCKAFRRFVVKSTKGTAS